VRISAGIPTQVGTTELLVLTVALARAGSLEQTRTEPSDGRRFGKETST
jgi:hypothetical protein